MTTYHSAKTSKRVVKTTLRKFEKIRRLPGTFTLPFPKSYMYNKLIKTFKLNHFNLIMNAFASLSKKVTFYSEMQILFCQRGMALYLFFHYYCILQASFIAFNPSEILNLNIILALTCLIFLNLFTQFFAFLCWIFCSFFLFSNTYLYGINHDYVGWLLLAISAVRVSKNKPFMPSVLYNGAWIVLGLGYFASGYNKLFLTDYWHNGNALKLLYASSPVFINLQGLENNYYVEILLKFLTWTFMYVEILFLPALLNKYTRFAVYFIMLFGHVGIATTTNMMEVSISIILFHVFVFDSRWLAKSYWSNPVKKLDLKDG